MIKSISFFWCLIFTVCLVFYSCSSDVPRFSMIEKASSDQLWTGVAVSEEGRIFVNYPRWIPNIKCSVAELVDSVNVIPFPDGEWNSWDGEKDPKNYFVCVQSVYIDDNNILWILDAGMSSGRGVIDGGAKLVKVNLKDNSILDVIYFNKDIALQRTYLNDVRVDTKNNFAFITDSGLGALIVVNLDTKNSRRVLTDHSSTKAEDIVLTIHGEAWLRPDSSKPQIHSDGIALDMDKGFVYYQALTARNLYRVPVIQLEDFSIPVTDIGKSVEHVTVSGASDGIMFDMKNRLFLSSLEESAIRYIDNNGEIKVAVKDDNLDWPDSFSITKKGEIYFTDSKLNKAYQPGVKYKIYKIVYE